MGEKSTKELRGYFTEDEYNEILEWLDGQRKFAKPSHFIRYAVFTVMKKTRPGSHHKLSGKPVGRPKKEKIEKSKKGHREENAGNNDAGYAESTENQGAQTRPNLPGKFKELPTA